MRLLHIMAGKGQGGAETYSTDMILSLHQEGIDQCAVISRKAPRYAELKAAGVRMAPEILDWPFRFLQRWQMKKLIEREQPDLIHCWMRRAASLMPRKKRTKALPIIGWFGGYYDSKHFGVCTDFVGCTNDIRLHQIKSGVPQDHAFFVPTFPDIRPEPAIERASVATPDGAPVVLALSRLHQKKGLDTLLKSAAQLPGVYFWLAGEGPLRAELEQLVKELKITERVRFLGWRTDRAALLRAADVCALPSRYEPFGTVILEAWAAKTPFVACKSAGPKAHVADGVNGLLVEIDDVDGLANALRRAIEDKELRVKMVDAGFDLYKNRYTREAVTVQMTSLYRKLIDGFSK